MGDVVRSVLLVDRNLAAAGCTGDLLRERGYVTQIATELPQNSEAASATIILLHLESEADLAQLEALRTTTWGQAAAVIAHSDIDSESLMTRSFELGADDFVRTPFRKAELLARVDGVVKLRESTKQLLRKQHDAQVLLSLTQALASSLDFREILFTVVRSLADVVRVDRVSIVLADTDNTDTAAASNFARVVATSDDQSITNLRLELSKYPEIQQVLRTREALIVEDAQTHPVLDGVRADVANLKLSSLALLPIVWNDQAIGVLFLRASATRGSLRAHDLAFSQTIANACAIALRNARAIETLRDRTQKATSARMEAEKRLDAFKKYFDLFESTADGIAVVDADGRLLFANPRAYAISGYEESDLEKTSILTLIAAEDTARASEIWKGIGAGAFPRAVDLRLRRKSGELRTIEISFAHLHDTEGATLASFRDVTESRMTDLELIKTKRFLESLFEASPDGIVAADLSGRILLFNKGAERIYGYSPEEVIGNFGVRKLYPPGGAEQIMRMIRGPLFGGPGRIDNARVEALDYRGERVPISISAALIYEDGKPVATFGIFTDLRERIGIEQRLQVAQEKLAVSEKQAVIAELAGTAAHELNQPLTSVMGYAELLKRKLLRGSTEYSAADTIVHEAERMADIVRKIGKITRYETKSYVGSQRILDLDRSIEGDVMGATGTGAPR